MLHVPDVAWLQPLVLRARTCLHNGWCCAQGHPGSQQEGGRQGTVLLPLSNLRSPSLHDTLFLHRPAAETPPSPHDEGTCTPAVLRGVGAGGRVTTPLSGAPHVVMCSPSAHFCWILKTTSTLPCCLHPRLGCGGCIWEHFPGSKVPGWLPGRPSTAPRAAPATALRPRWGQRSVVRINSGLAQPLAGTRKRSMCVSSPTATHSRRGT